MIVHLMFASTIGQIFKPLYELLAGIIAFFYSIIPNFAVAIALLTVVVMIVTAPLTVKSTRSTIKMQRVAPELKKIQAKYKGDRVTLNEEMMKLYKEHGINPAGGCLPMLIQLPVFVVLYGVIRGLTNTVKGKNGIPFARPDYVSHSTRLYHDLIAAKGHMQAFGLDLGNNVFSHHAHWYGAIPYVAIVGVAIGLQYLQMRQLNSRNPGAAQANPQMQMMQRYMPLIFAVIYIRISAGVNIYFVVSSLCRIGIQEGIFRSGVLDKASTRGEGKLPGRGGSAGAPRRSIMERLANAQQRALEQQKARQSGLQAEIDMPREPKDEQKPAGTKPSGAKPPAGKPPVTKPKGDAASSNGGGSSNGTAAPNDAGKPGGTAKRPNGAHTNGGAQRGSAKAGSNGAPAPKEQPPGQPRSAKKRPRKAR
ncbi:MAG TPA: membrane protein insertase YidC [Acidimicrobiales bacterium]